MQAIVYAKYGPPEEALMLREVEKPAPKENQVLVKVHAASANALDWRRFTMPLIVRRLMEGGRRTPKDAGLGADLAGTVEAVGSNVTEFRPRDEVFGVGVATFAEFALAGKSKVVLKPAHVSFEAAAAVPVAGFTALQGLRDKGHIQPGQKVLIDGASGGVGTMAVQIAKYYRAEVTAVCSTRNLEMARSLGADHVIDYTQVDFTKSGQRYDLILAVNGHHPILHYKRALSPRGTCVVAGGPLPQIFMSMLLGPLVSEAGGQQIGFQGIATSPQEDLLFLKELLETGKIVPVIDRCYPLSAAAEAIRYLVDEHARGKVIISVTPAQGARV